MAKKKNTTDQPKPLADPERESRIVQPGGIHADDLEVLEGDIDSRLDALLKDHQDMGARPK